MNKFIKPLIPNFTAVLVFLLVSYVYFFPAIEGKVLQGTDNITAKSQQGEIMTFNSLEGGYCAWTNGSFAGMPAYTIWVKHDAPIKLIERFFQLLAKRGPVSYLFIAMFSFYILLCCYGVNPWLGIIGAFAYAFSSYYLVIIGAGHVSKVIALSYMPGVFAGIYLVYNKKKVWLGSALMAIFLALEIRPGHYQIIYYTILLVVALGIYRLIQAYKEDTLPFFIKSTLILLVSALIAGLTNISSVWTTNEYAKYSARGEVILNDTNSTSVSNDKGGLDFDYATQWSYGVGESFNLFIPNFRGGSSVGKLSENSEVYRLFSQRNRAQAKQIIEQLPLYWGDQPSTEGPQYMGALALFLFVFAMFFVRSKEKWWIFIISIFALLLAWGHNFETFNRFMFHYLPLYNKFRAVSTTLVIVQFLIPFLGILAIHQLITDYDRNEFTKALKWSVGLTGGVALLFVLLPGMAGSFTGPIDARYSNNQPFVDALMIDRKALLRNDALRSLFFVLAGGAVLWLYHIKKLSSRLLIVLLAVLTLLDLGLVGTRYVSHNDFKTEKSSKAAFIPTKADMSIYSMEIQNPEVKQKVDNLRKEYPKLNKSDSPELKALNMATDYKVLNLADGINFSDALTSYYHKSLSGYSPAKLRRYQDLIDRGVLVRQIQNLVGKLQNKADAGNYNVLNMLNTKYVIFNRDQSAYKNDQALGNAWFVKNVHWVENSDEEFNAMQNIDPIDEVVVHQEYKDFGIDNLAFDSTATIQLTDYKPNVLKYKSESKTDMVAVFSEMYYPAGWKVFVDGKGIDYFRTNYFLRGLKVPRGEHQIEFRFEPRSYLLGNTINRWSSLLLLVFFIVVAVPELLRWLKKQKELPLQAN